MLKTYTTSPLTYEFEGTGNHIISVQNNATYDFSHDNPTHDGLIELSIPYYDDYVLQLIPDKIFMNCIDLSSVEGALIKTVGKIAFNFCDQLRYVNLPKAIKFNLASFKDCNLSVLVLSDANNVTEIEVDTFQNNFRRPISVYIPGNLSSKWYDSTENNNWKYIISSELSAISTDYIDKNYSIVVLSSNDLQYNNQVNNILLSTSNLTSNCQNIWNRLYPDILSNFKNLATTISVLRYTYDDSEVGERQYFDDLQKQYLVDALTASTSDGNKLSDIMEKCNIDTLNKYCDMSSNTADYKYINNLQKITQFPVYDFEKLNIFERYRPLSSSIGILSSKVDYESAKKNIYRKTQNTVMELDNIFAPLSTFCYLLSTGTEISGTIHTLTDLLTVQTAINFYSDALLTFRDIIK